MKKLALGVLAVLLLQFCSNNLEEVTELMEDHIDHQGNHDLSIPSEAFLVQYFASPDQVTPFSSRIENRIRHDFNSPVKPGINSQILSARWTGEFYFEKGAYTFNVNSDKRVRVTVNNELILDEVAIGVEEKFEITKEMEEGEQIVEVEYNLGESNTEPVGPSPNDPSDTTSTDPVGTAPWYPADTTSNDPIGTSPTEPADTTSTNPVGTSPTDPADTTQTGPVDVTPNEPVVETDNNTPTVEVDWSPSSEPDQNSDSLMHPSMTLHPMGWAASTVGGAGGRIIKVTNLNTSGPGSLREAIKTSGPRIIVFEVGGIIDLAGEYLTVRSPNMTILGQTAPNPGITLIKGTLAIQVDEVIVQHLRFRVGEGSGFSADGIETDGAKNVVIDHCSFAWAIDENLTAAGPNFGKEGGEDVYEWRQNTSRTITFSNNIIAEGLNNSIHPSGPHSKGTLVTENCTEIALIRNIYASNARRNPYIGGGSQAVIVNNYIYNPGDLAINYLLWDPLWEGHSHVAGKLTVIGNVMERGINTSLSIAYMHSFGLNDLYWKDNTVIGPTVTTFSSKSNHNLVETKPVWHDNIEVLPSGVSLKDKLLLEVGARPWDRDEVDKRIIQEIKDGTNRIIDSENEVGGYPTATPAYREFDPILWGLGN